VVGMKGWGPLVGDEKQAGPGGLGVWLWVERESSEWVLMSDHGLQ
jgi:hypothetical protein